MNLQKTIDTMILSASGWRGIFAKDGDGESMSGEISDDHVEAAALAGFVFADYLKTKYKTKRPCVIVGFDTRPTNYAIASPIIYALMAQDCDVLFAGVVAAPEIMAYARSFGNDAKPAAHGFIYVSASHNPVGYNGLKFGLLDGGVLNVEDAEKLIGQFKASAAKDTIENIMASKLESVEKDDFLLTTLKAPRIKDEALKTYLSFAKNVIAGDGIDAKELFYGLKHAITKNPVGLVADFNGSARALSIDRDIFLQFGAAFSAINEKPGVFAHRIVPEGDSLIPCCEFLEKMHGQDSRYCLGYVPDCDGDRGNLVIWDDKKNAARPLEGQEVFALCCVSELAHLWDAQGTLREQRKFRDPKQIPSRYATPALRLEVALPDAQGIVGARSVPVAERREWSDSGTPQSPVPALAGMRPEKKIAVAVNDATSMRIDKIAAYFGVETFRAETGEANVVTLARNLRKKDYLVRFLGEGAAGGNITHPSAVRDPIYTVMAIIKLCRLRGDEQQKGFFEIWCEKSAQMAAYKPDFTLSDIIETLPPFTTTSAYSPEAVLKIKTDDHGKLKNEYQRIFERDWQKNDWHHYGISGYYVCGFNGSVESRLSGDWGVTGTGGLKIVFTDDAGNKLAALWMRGSGTEPVFRVMADVDGDNRQLERELLKWQRRMVLEADENLCG